MAVIVTLGTVKRLSDQDHFTDNNNDEMRSSYTISDLSDALMPLFITSQSFENQRQITIAEKCSNGSRSG